MEPTTEVTEVAMPWQQVMRDQGRKFPWLAKQTGKSESTVWKYSYGIAPAPKEWLEKVSVILGVKVR